jgi:hypothetical protein
MGKMTDAIKSLIGATPLEKVPVLLSSDVRLEEGPLCRVGQTQWLPRDVAQQCVRQGAGTILAACSVLKKFRGIQVSSTLLPLPRAEAEKLEAEGFLKIVETEEQLAIHRAAWTAHAEVWRDRRDRYRQMLAEADTFMRQADKDNREAPVIDWQKGSVAQPAA